VVAEAFGQLFELSADVEVHCHGSVGRRHAGRGP
jgi:hypothetical protein